MKDSSANAARAILASREPRALVSQIASAEGYNFTSARIETFCTGGYRNVVLPALRAPNGWETTVSAFQRWLVDITTAQPRIYRLAASPDGGLWKNPTHPIPIRGASPLPPDFLLGFKGDGGGIGSRFAIGYLPDHSRGRLVAIYQFVTAKPRVVAIPMGTVLPLFHDLSCDLSNWWRWTGDRGRHFLSTIGFVEASLFIQTELFSRRDSGAQRTGGERVEIGDPDLLRHAFCELLFASGITVGVSGANISRVHAAEGRPCSVCGEQGTVNGQNFPCYGNDAGGITCCSWEEDNSYGKNVTGHFLHLGPEQQERVVECGE
jgi:hypothetical protein